MCTSRSSRQIEGQKRLHAERADQLIRLHVAEPAPLGLFGLAMGCLILMCVDWEFTGGLLMLIPWIFVLPALAQLIAGIFDFMRHNVFGGTAFIGYALFWFGLSWVYYFEIEYAHNEDIAKLLPTEKPHFKREHTAVICIGYLMFSVILSVVSLGVNRILLSILIAIDIAFFLLILHLFHPNTIPSWLVGIGICGIFLTAMYGFIAFLLLKIAGGEVLPIGAPFLHWADYVIVNGVRQKPQSFITEVKKKKRTRRNSQSQDTNVDIHEIIEDMNGQSNGSTLEIQVSRPSNSERHIAIEQIDSISSAVQQNGAKYRGGRPRSKTPIYQRVATEETESKFEGGYRMSD